MSLEGDGGDEFPDQNPFLMQPIIQVMMSQMSVTELKNSRLVCSIWDDQSVFQLKQSKCQNDIRYIRDQWQKDVKKFIKEVKHPEIFTKFCMSFNERYFSKICENPNLDVLSNFKVTELILDFSKFRQLYIHRIKGILNWSQIFKIVAHLSPTLKRLKFQCLFTGRRDETPIDFDENVQVKFPALEIFEFDMERDERLELCEGYGQLVRKILNNSPKLDKIKILRFPKNEETFKNLLETRGFQGITKFTIEQLIDYGNNDDHSGFFEINDAEYLSKLHLNEIKVDYYDLTRSLGHKGFLKFLGSQSGTLTLLHIKFSFTNEAQEACEFPVLEKLKYFKCIFGYHYLDQFIIPFDFEEKFPNLVKFELNSFRVFQKFIRNRNGGSINVKYLNVFETFSFEMGKKISQIFPKASPIKFLPKEGSYRDYYYDIGESIHVKYRDINNLLITKMCTWKIKCLEDLKLTEQVVNILDLEMIKFEFLDGGDITLDNFEDLLNVLITIRKKAKNLKQINFANPESFDVSQDVRKLFANLSSKLTTEYKSLKIVNSFESEKYKVSR